MEQPYWFETGNTVEIYCRLWRSLLGLMKAPFQCKANIDALLVDNLSMKGKPAEEFLYIRHQSSTVLIIALYVDDLLIACNDEETLWKTKEEFTRKFRMK